MGQMDATQEAVDGHLPTYFNASDSSSRLDYVRVISTPIIVMRWRHQNIYFYIAKSQKLDVSVTLVSVDLTDVVPNHTQGAPSFSTLIFHDFSMTKKNENP